MERLTQKRKQPYILYLIIASTCFITWLAWQYPDLQKLLMDRSDIVIDQGQWYRLITSAFLHKDGNHLANNIILLALSGFPILRKSLMKQSTFLILYITAIFITAYVSHTYDTDNGTIYYRLGASGGVFAILASSILLLWGNYRISPLIILAIASREYQAIDTDNIGHISHLIGILYGSLFTCLLYPKIPHTQLQREDKHNHEDYEKDEWA